MDCEWTIPLGSAVGVRLTILAMDLEAHPTCLYDYIEIRQYNSQGPLLSPLLCGRTPPATIQSNTSLWIHFHSDGSVTGTGFIANYTIGATPTTPTPATTSTTTRTTTRTTPATTIGCGQTLTSSQGTFSSPNYPLNYPVLADCEWTIPVGSAVGVRLTIQTMDLETNPTCNWDYIEIRQYNSQGPLLLPLLCGRTLPASIQSYTTLYIRFHSDISVTGTGFTATYTIGPTNLWPTTPTPATTTTTTPATIIGCGQALTSSQGTFSSPNYPLNYQNMMDCVWTIPLGSAVGVRLTIQTMDLETQATCQYDYIEIRQTNSQGPLLLPWLCGGTPPATIQSYTSVWIHFHSDISVTGTGFTATYTLG